MRDFGGVAPGSLRAGVWKPCRSSSTGSERRRRRARRLRRSENEPRGLRLEFEHRPAIAGPLAGDGAALCGGAEEMSLRVADEAGNRLIAVGAARLGCEIVDHAFAPRAVRLRDQFVDCAAALALRGLSAAIGRAEQVTVQIKHGVLERQRTV